MDIVACTDKRFVMPTGVMMYSVCCNNEDADIVFHVVCSNDVSGQDKKDLSGEIQKFNGKSIEFYHIDNRFLESIPEIDYCPTLTITTYFRLFLPEILPDSIEKVLYLDGDIIVLNSLLPLWELPMADFSVAAASDIVEVEPQNFDRLGYPMQKGYFNAGVLLINLEWWRRNNCQKTFIELIKDGDYLYHDQDILNLVFYDTKYHLPLKYNLTAVFMYKSPKLDNSKYEAEIEDALKNAFIIHYTTREKPWFKYKRNPHPLENIFFKYQKNTVWKGRKYDYRTPKLKFINFIADMMRCLGLKPHNQILEVRDLSMINS